MNIGGFHYYAQTWDVCAWPDAEDDDLQIVASFATRDDALAFVKGRHDVVFVRPPHRVLLDAIAFLTYVGAVATNGYGNPVPKPTSL